VAAVTATTDEVNGERGVRSSSCRSMSALYIAPNSRTATRALYKTAAKSQTGSTVLTAKGKKQVLLIATCALLVHAPQEAIQRVFQLLQQSSHCDTATV
jgi:hypothetical protein